MGQPRRVGLGKWAPDVPTLEAPNLYGAKGCLPRGVGYGPMSSLVALTSFGALGAYARGSYHTTDPSGTPNNFAGDATKLWRIQAGAWTNVSKAGNYTPAATSRWEFLEFSGSGTGRLPLVIASDFDDPIQVYEIGVSALFADLAAAAPRARHLAVIGQHLMVGHTVDATDGLVPNRIWWPALGNATSWPTPRTTAAISAQSDRQELYGPYGAVNGIIGASTYGTIFRERAIHRADYVGGEIMFNLDRVESQRGLAVPGLAVPFGSKILYFSEDGWFIFDGAESNPVGKDVLDDWFRREFVWEYRHRVSTLVDPDYPILHIGFTGPGHSSGTPNRVLHYNWVRNAFAWSPIEHEYLTLVVNPGPDLTMDRSPSPIPDQLSGSWDDVQTATRVAGAFNASHQLATFTGSALAAEFETGDFELAPGRRSTTQHIRPIVTGGEPSVSIAKMATRDASVNFGTAKSMGTSGKCDIRADGRYHRLKLNIAAGWNGDAIALDVESFPTGIR